MSALSETERIEWERDGWFVRRGVYSEAECRALLATLGESVKRLAIERPDLCRSINDFNVQAKLANTDNPLVVWWADKVDVANTPHDELPSIVNRMGQNLAGAIPEVRAALSRPGFIEPATELIGGPIAAFSTQVNYKRSGDELGTYPIHQMAWFCHNDALGENAENEIMFAYIALERADEQNACMRALPGSHHGPVHMRAEHSETEGFRWVQLLDGIPNLNDCSPIVVDPGDVVFMHGKTYHGSGVNKDPHRSRVAMIAHLCRRGANVRETAWLQQELMPLGPDVTG